MLTPKYLESVPEHLVAIYSEVESDIIADMCARLSKMDFIPSAQWQYNKLIEMGFVHDHIVSRLSSVSGLTAKEIEQLITDSGFKAIVNDNHIYHKSGLEPPVLSASPALQAVLQSGINNTNGLFNNLTRATASTATKQFEDMLDRTWLNINSGAFDYNSAIRMAVKDLSSRGIAAVEYPSGHKDYLDVAVRRATLTGVNQTSLSLQEALADEMGCDLVDVTAHAGARSQGVGPANHSQWQGKRYSRSGKHLGYPALRETTGYKTGEGLGGWNCRHNMFPAFEGMDPVYTQEELDELNAPKYEYNGKQLTEEEAQNRQRIIERSIRKWKREYVGMEAAGQSTDEAAAKLRTWQEKQKDFLNQTGFKRKYDKENVGGFGTKEAAKARGQSTKLKNEQENLVNLKETEYTKKRQDVLDRINSGELSLTLNIGNQNKHIRDSKGYILGRSYIYGDVKTAQAFVDQHHGTGEIRFNQKGKWINKEFVQSDKDIGVWVNQKTGEEMPTNVSAIHYGQKGPHIIPARRRNKN